ncbi:MAG: trimethylamine methyltransferase family protein [Pseudomonadota bacterium]
MNEEPRRKGRRGGGRAGQARRGRSGGLSQPPWKVPVISDPTIDPLTDEGVEAVHEGAMRILEEIGIEFLNQEALTLFRKSGAKVDGERVWLDRDFVMEMVAKAPDRFTITPRNPDRELTMGAGHLNFGAVGSPPNYWDLETGKVPGTRAQCQDLFRLTQAMNCIHFNAGYPVEPVDVHASVRHLDVVFDMLTLTDKVVHAYSLGPERVEDVMEMVKLAAGIDEATFQSRPHMFTNINSTSPLKHDQPMIDGCLRCVRRGQAVVVTPFTLAGAMAPVTLAGAVAQSLAEALSAIALFRWVAPGSAAMIGTFTSNVDMKSGAPAFGTPEYMRATQMTGQMARFYGLPMRSSGSCAANVPDGQAMWETAQALWTTVHSGTSMVYHAAGWLEGGLIASPEKLIMDCEILHQIIRYFDPELVSYGAEDVAVDAIAEVDALPASERHFFGIDHTQNRYETAFYQPFLSDWQNYEGWQLAGGVWTHERAHRMFKDIVGSFEAPAMPGDRLGALTAFVAKRKEEGGAPTDF